MEINELQREKFESDSLTKLIPALIKAKQEFPKLVFNKTGKHGSSYADISGILECVEKHLLSNGLVITQPIVTVSDGHLYLYTLLEHSSGEFKSGKIELLRPANNDMQTLGAQITYARRYCMASMLNVAAEEDDDCDMQNTEANKTSSSQNNQEQKFAGTGAISDKQLEWIKKLLVGWPILTQKILEKEKLNSLEEIQKEHFNKIKDNIEVYKAKQGTDK